MEYLVFELDFIGIIQYIDTFKELKKQGYEKSVIAFYTDETKLYKIIEVWHLSNNRAPSFYKEYKVGYITHFSDKNKINLSKIKTSKKISLITSLFEWSSYNFI